MNYLVRKYHEDRLETIEDKLEELREQIELLENERDDIEGELAEADQEDLRKQYEADIRRGL